MTTPRLRLWHGGAPGRKAGDLLLPPVVTGLTYTRLQMSVEGGQTEISQRLDRVYLTSDRELAWAFASMWSPDGLTQGGGSLYRVEADVLEPDEDLLSLPGVSFQAATAEVLGASEIGVPLFIERCASVFQRVLADHAAAKD